MQSSNQSGFLKSRPDPQREKCRPTKRGNFVLRLKCHFCNNIDQLEEKYYTCMKQNTNARCQTQNAPSKIGATCVHTSKKTVFAVAELRRQFEFSAEGLSENAKSIKITLFAELLMVFLLFLFSHCNKLSIKTRNHTLFSTKMPH